ncbi:MAG: EamA family transporter [Anaerolineae bacterium]|nr:EamA family transporter [Anaerolineae bacterium]
MFRSLSPHSRAVLTALFVTFLWATSWVIIKFGLRDNIPPLTFAGLRYSLAALCLLPLVLRQPKLRNSLREFSPRQWQLLIVLGLVFIGVAQGAQFVSLSYLPAVTVNLLLSFTTIAVTALGILFLHERPLRAQWLGLGLYLAGVVIFFYPVTLSGSDFIGIAAALICLTANAVGVVLGRALNRTATMAPIVVTLITMSIGGLAMLVTGIILEPDPAFSLPSILAIVWLAAVNTAFAFTLYNRTLQTLTAIESNIINNMMLVFIPGLAWLFLGETITPKALLALVLATGGIFTVTLARWDRPLGSLRAFTLRK